MRKVMLAPALIFLLGTATSCSSDPGATSSGSIVKVSGDNQSVATGVTLPVAPSVKITDQNGTVVNGATVTFAVASGGGTITGGTATTGADGIAKVGSWKVGTTAGANSLTATANGITGSPLTFTATALSVAALTKLGGDGQSAPSNTQLPVPLTVKITDAAGNPVAGISVTFAITSGAGSIGAGGNQRQAVTDASGVATMNWILGPVAGSNTAVVFTAGTNVTGNNAVFTETGT